MLFKLLRHDRLAIRRSPLWTHSAISTIFLGLFAVYFVLVLFGLGVMAQELIAEFLPELNARQAVSRYMIYYLLMDLMTRFTLQKFPSLALKKYLVHNIKKSTLAKYLCIRSLFSFFNFAPFFFFLPFFLINIGPTLVGTPQWLQWFIALVLLIGINHFLAFFIDKNLAKKAYISVSILVLASISLILDSQGIFSLTSVFEPIFDFVFSNPISLIVLGVLLTALVYGLYTMFRKSAYLDMDYVSSGISRTEFTFFDYFGPRLAPLLKLEAKLIWRNRRSRHYFYASIAFLLFPFILMGDEELSGTKLNLVISLMITGAFTLNYGQLIYSWNSEHFDLLLTRNIRLKDYLESKFIILALSNVFFFGLSLLFYFVYPELVVTNTVMALFNTGVTIFVYMFLSVTASKKIDANEGGAFSFEGFGAAHYLVIIPLIALPLIIHAAFAQMSNEWGGLISLGVIGLLGILFRSQLINMAERHLHDRKYELIANFKK